MFESVGWGEVAVVVLAALFIFGPERLPGLARDAATAMKRARHALHDLRSQVDDSLGPELSGLQAVDPGRFRPATFIRAQLLDDSPSNPRSHSGPRIRGGGND